MSHGWFEKLAVFAMVLGLIALAAVCLAALFAAAAIFLCLAAILYLLNPSGMRDFMKAAAGKPDEWFAKANVWLESFKEILTAFQSAAQAACSDADADAGKAGSKEASRSTCGTGRQPKQQ